MNYIRLLIYGPPKRRDITIKLVYTAFGTYFQQYIPYKSVTYKVTNDRFHLLDAHIRTLLGVLLNPTRHLRSPNVGIAI